MGGRRLDRTPRKISHPLDQFSKNGFSPTSLFPNANDTFLAVELSTSENRWGVVSYVFSMRYLGVRRVTRHGNGHASSRSCCSLTARYISTILRGLCGCSPSSAFVLLARGVDDGTGIPVASFWGCDFLAPFTELHFETHQPDVEDLFPDLSTSKL